jgi:hypothetical protein
MPLVVLRVRGPLGGALRGRTRHFARAQRRDARRDRRLQRRQATAVVGEERTDVRAGSVLIVPSHTAHHFDQTQGGFVAVAVFSPPLT